MTILHATVATFDLHAALKEVYPACDRKASPRLPILSHVLVSVTPDGVVFTCTDFDNTERRIIPGTVEVIGGFAVRARLLRDIAAQLLDLDAPVVLRVTDERPSDLSVTCGEASFNLRGWPADDFPRVDAATPTTAPVVRMKKRRAVELFTPPPKSQPIQPPAQRTKAPRMTTVTAPVVTRGGCPRVSF